MVNLPDMFSQRGCNETSLVGLGVGMVLRHERSGGEILQICCQTRSHAGVNVCFKVFAATLVKYLTICTTIRVRPCAYECVSPSVPWRC